MPHTPGPWASHTFRFGSDSPFVAIKATAMTFGYNRDRTEPGVVCLVQTAPGRHLDQSEADAKLIAAAPDLLDALRGVLRVADRATDEFDAARAAIAKATA